MSHAARGRSCAHVQINDSLGIHVTPPFPCTVLYCTYSVRYCTLPNHNGRPTTTTKRKRKWQHGATKNVHCLRLLKIACGPTVLGLSGFAVSPSSTSIRPSIPLYNTVPFSCNCLLTFGVKTGEEEEREREKKRKRFSKKPNNNNQKLSVPPTDRLPFAL